MSEKLLIQNQAKFQVFLSLFSSAIVGCASSQKAPTTIAKRADDIAVAAYERFETHIPEAHEIVEGGPKQGKVIQMPEK